MLFVPRPGLEKLLLRWGPLGARVAITAKRIENEARARVEVLSGDTQRSGRTVSTDDGYRVVFSEAARYLEFGAYGREFPFLRPAADAVAPGKRRAS
jgi:hypothetical protein